MDSDSAVAKKSRDPHQTDFVQEPQRFLEFVGTAWRMGGDGLVAEITLDIACELVGRSVSAGGLFLEALHHNPIQVASNALQQSRWFSPTLPGDLHPDGSVEGVQSG